MNMKSWRWAKVAVAVMFSLIIIFPFYLMIGNGLFEAIFSFDSFIISAVGLCSILLPFIVWYLNSRES